MGRSNFNKVIFEGRLGRDPELRYSKDQKPILKFSIAVDKTTSTGAEFETKTMWLDVTCFGLLAERLSNKLEKGFLVIVDGKLAINEWTAKDTGIAMQKPEITANEVIVSGYPKSHKNNEPKLEIQPKPKQPESASDMLDDDIPF